MNLPSNLAISLAGSVIAYIIWLMVPGGALQSATRTVIFAALMIILMLLLGLGVRVDL